MNAPVVQLRHMSGTNESTTVDGVRAPLREWVDVKHRFAFSVAPAHVHGAKKLTYCIEQEQEPRPGQCSPELTTVVDWALLCTFRKPCKKHLQSCTVVLSFS